MPPSLSIPEAINRILMNYDTEQNDKNIELFIEALRHSESLNIDFTTAPSSIKPLMHSSRLYDDTDDIDEQLLTMTCFEEIDYYYIDKLSYHIKDI
jgi:hypothetical protein